MHGIVVDGLSWAMNPYSNRAWREGREGTLSVDFRETKDYVQRGGLACAQVCFCFDLPVVACSNGSGETIGRVLSWF